MPFRMPSRLPVVRSLVCTAGLLLLLLAVAASPALAAFGEKRAFGAFGTAQGQFETTAFVDVDPTAGQVIVGRGHTGFEPLRFVPFETDGTALPVWGSTGAPDSFFGDVRDGAVAAGERALYTAIGDWQEDIVGDGPITDALLRFALGSGHAMTRFAPAEIGDSVSDATTLATGDISPIAIAAVPAGATGGTAGDIWVAGWVGTAGGAPTSVRLALRRFNADGTPAGGLVGNGNGTGAGQFNPADDGLGIRAIAADPADGSVWVLDGLPENDATDPVEAYFGRLQHFGADGALIPADTITAELPTPGDPGLPISGNEIADLAVAADGSLIVNGILPGTTSDPTTHNPVLQLAEQGGSWSELRRFGESGTGTCQFPALTRLAVDGDEIYTATAHSTATQDYARVRVFGEGGSGCAAATQAPVITPGSVVANPASPLKGVETALTAAATDADTPAGDLEWVWDTDGDGGFDTLPSSSPQASVTFDTPGPRTLKVKVSDPDGNAAEAELDVQVTSQKPTAAFTVSNASPQVGQAVTFDAAGSSDPDGTIVKYEWSTGAVFSEGGATFATAFQSAGTVTVRLRVTDSDGDSATVSQVVTVSAAPGPGPGGDPPSPPPPGPPADVTGPVVGIGSAKLSATSLRVSLSCPSAESRCAGTLTLASAGKVATKKKGKKKVLSIGRASFSMDGGQSRAVTIKLSSTARKLLAKGNLKARLSYRAADAAGNDTSGSKTLTLKKLKKKKGKSQQ